MKDDVSAEVAEQSNRVFWVIQTMFGVVIGKSFYECFEYFLLPQKVDYLTFGLSAFFLYVCALLSWIDYSASTVTYPYRFAARRLDTMRFLVDLIIVLIYTFVFLLIHLITKDPRSNLGVFFWMLPALFCLYLVSGVIRIASTHDRLASHWLVILGFAALYGTFAYEYDYQYAVWHSVALNRRFLFCSIVALLAFRVLRWEVEKRRREKCIAVDVDGVIANQIEGVLPVIRSRYGKDVKYDDITDWRWPVTDSVNIADIIINEQKQKDYVLGMPALPGAVKTINRLAHRHRIVIATARDPASDPWTRRWLYKKWIHYDSYYNAKENAKQNIQEDADLLIDDYIGNIQSFLSTGRRKAILMDQPWNRSREELQQFIKEGRLATANGWSEVASKVSLLLGRPTKAIARLTEGSVGTDHPK